MSGREREFSVPPGLLLVGFVRKPHGVRGEVSVELVGDNPSRFRAGSRLVVVHAGEERGSEVVVETARLHRQRYLIRFAGYSAREEAERLRGAAVCVPESEARPRQGQVFLKDLPGLRVVDESGRVLGEVARVLEYPAQDVLEISTARGTKLLPLVRELVPEVDLEAGRIVVRPPEGIFEDSPAGQVR